MKFAYIQSDNNISEKQYDTLVAAEAAADEEAIGNPDVDILVVQILESKTSPQPIVETTKIE